jgi:hypothetical protein
MPDLRLGVQRWNHSKENEDGNVIAGKMLDMVVEQDNVFIVCEVQISLRKE